MVDNEILKRLGGGGRQSNVMEMEGTELKMIVKSFETM